MSEVAEGPVRRFPSLGEHTAELLREELGLGDAELAGLRARRAIG
jgi:crotonobetainyl-CoA:carnitine CoA-transferase CaiB-like acyl-CoA transferase